MRYAQALFILTALVLHLFFGQHDAPAPLILCLGENGHVAVESTQLLSEAGTDLQMHTGTQADSLCPAEKNCRDIALSLGHSDHYLTVKMPVSQLAIQLAQSGLLRIAQVEAFFSPAQSVLAVLDRESAHLQYSETIQGLQTTVLLI